MGLAADTPPLYIHCGLHGGRHVGPGQNLLHRTSQASDRGLSCRAWASLCHVFLGIVPDMPSKTRGTFDHRRLAPL